MSEAALRERIDYLEAEVDRLNRIIGAAASAEQIDRVRRRFRISPGVARLLLVLLSGAPGKVWTREALHHAYCDHKLEQPDVQIVDVQMVHLRQALARHSVTIETIRAVGYRLAPDMRAKLEAILS